MTPQKGLDQLSAAITISPSFREKILNPETREEAIKNGYLGEPFDLDENELRIISEIPKVYSEGDFTRKLLKGLGKEL